MQKMEQFCGGEEEHNYGSNRSHLYTSELGMTVDSVNDFFPKKIYLSMWRKRYHVCATQSLSISMGIRMASSSGTLNGGKDGP